MVDTKVFKARVRDPAWQAVGVIVAVIATAISVVVSYDIYSRSHVVSQLTINTFGSYSPALFTDSWGIDAKLNINGEAVSAVKLTGYHLANSGTEPIQSDDFVQPLTVTVREPVRIVGVFQDAKRNPNRIQLTWSKISDQEFVLQPLLLNAHESAMIHVVCTAPDRRALEDDALARPSWSGRIHRGSLQIVDEKNTSRSIYANVMGLYVSHSGAEIYLLLIVASAMLALLLRARPSFFGHPTTRQTVYVVLAAVLSFSGAEVVVDLLGSRGGNQPIAAIVVILAFAAALWALIWFRPSYSTDAARVSTRMIPNHSGAEDIID